MVHVFHPLELNNQKADHNKTPHCMIDQAIFEAEKEVEEGREPIPLNIARECLDRKYYGIGNRIEVEIDAFQQAARP